MSGTPNARSFEALLDMHDEVAVLEALEPLIPVTEATAGARRMVDLLTRTQLYLTTSGVSQLFEADDLAGQWLLVEGAWTALGAARAAALAGAIASLFPGGRVPVGEDERFARYRALLEDSQDGRPDGDPWRGIGIFTRLDFEFADAPADVAHAVQRLLQAHRADPVGALVEVAARAQGLVPPARTTEWAEYVDNGLTGAAGAAARKAQWAEVLRAAPEAQEELHDPAADERVLRFLDDVGRLTVDDWSRVAGRRLATTPARRGLELGFGVLRKRVRRGLTPAARARLRESGASEPAIRAGQIARALPRIGLVGDVRGPLWHFAIRAVLQGLDAVLWYDDLLATAEGDDTLRVMLEPFDGYLSIALPPETAVG